MRPNRAHMLRMRVNTTLCQPATMIQLIPSDSRPRRKLTQTVKASSTADTVTAALPEEPSSARQSSGTSCMHAASQQAQAVPVALAVAESAWMQPVIALKP